MMSMFRRLARSISTGALAAYVLCANAGEVEIVRNGVSSAKTVTAIEASNQVRDAAALLARCIEKATGAAIPVNSSGAEERTLTVHVGTDAYVRGLDLGLRHKADRHLRHKADRHLRHKADRDTKQTGTSWS